MSVPIEMDVAISTKSRIPHRELEKTLHVLNKYNLRVEIQVVVQRWNLDDSDAVKKFP